jgi:uncharacterized protein DUF72
LSVWTDKSMLEEGHFYRYKSMSAEERLWWYSRFFDTVAVNSTFYALPSADTAALWVERTPPGFVSTDEASSIASWVTRVTQPARARRDRRTLASPRGDPNHETHDR